MRMKDFLAESLAALMQEKPFEKITINCFAELNEISAIITDEKLPINLKKAYEKSDVIIL